MSSKVYWFERNMIWYDALQNPDSHEVNYFGTALWYSMYSTGSVNGAPRNLMIPPTTCFNFRVMMFPLYHVKDIWSVSCYLLRSISETRILDVSKLVIYSPGWRSSSLFYLLILGGMENLEGSPSSSPDPLVELEAEVRVLRRRVRYQGHFLQQIDDMGGRHLNQTD